MPDPTLPVAAIDAAVRVLDLNDARNGIEPREGLALRVLKLVEECGEASAALIGLRGQNPRKSRSSEQDLVDELLDVALSALVTAASLTGSWAERFGDQVLAKTSRLVAAIPGEPGAASPAPGAVPPAAPAVAPGVGPGGDPGRPAGRGRGIPTAPSVMAMVREFHGALGDDLPGSPRLQDAATRRLRREFLAEEAAEAVAADENDDLVGLAQELADVVYVAYGTAARYGIPLDAVLAEIHRANLTKEAHPAGGKAVKGPTFRPADVAAVMGFTPAAPAEAGGPAGRAVDERVEP
ncbi:hypothetical protein MXD62_34415 [Frankia sp. Mgl5]|uniref:hypothetical protein n=1 Tax=Frankia sp. Mgl5 TaxID=2933793 RepID=UPI00200CD101|nr:hypothetical protein [Frankia sp. Mgl5]MCK9932176.1 hypothetical protein [Frankia sp. Mgl5]